MAAARLMLALLGRQARVEGGVGMKGSGTALPSSTSSLCRRSGATGLPSRETQSPAESQRGNNFPAIRWRLQLAPLHELWVRRDREHLARP